MRTLPTPEFLFLDFDGVLCDSLEECYRSSWLTISGTTVGPRIPDHPPFDAAYRARFDACRPFIRSGEDYIVVHQWAEKGLVPGSQAEFDASLHEVGAEVLADIKARLYRVREALLEHHRPLWLSWNPLYPGIADALASQVGNPAVWILSTKKAEFIGEILRHHGVSWPLERTLYTGPRRKLDIIEERVGSSGSVLIDDQVDHLDFSHAHCDCRLALWGYVAPGAEARAGATLTRDEAVALISGFRPGRPRPTE